MYRIGHARNQKQVLFENAEESHRDILYEPCHDAAYAGTAVTTADVESGLAVQCNPNSTRVTAIGMNSNRSNEVTGFKMCGPSRSILPMSMHGRGRLRYCHRFRTTASTTRKKQQHATTGLEVASESDKKPKKERGAGLTLSTISPSHIITAPPADHLMVVDIIEWYMYYK